MSDELPVESRKFNKDEENTQEAEKGQDLTNLEENNQEAEFQTENVVSGVTEEAKKPTQVEEQKDSQNTEAEVTDDSLSRNTLEKRPLVETKSTENVTAVTTLNPNAAEFIPGAALTLSSVVDVLEFLPESFALKERPPLLRKQLSTHETELENFVKDVLFGLTESPGELVEYVSLLASMLKKWLNELTSLKDTVDLIFEYVGNTMCFIDWFGPWGPFLESPGYFLCPKSHFKKHEVLFGPKTFLGLPRRRPCG